MELKNHKELMQLIQDEIRTEEWPFELEEAQTKLDLADLVMEMLCDEIVEFLLLN